MSKIDKEESTEIIYRQLQQHLDTLPTGFPATESGIEIKLLKRLFTPEEAKIAINLTFGVEFLEPLETIYKRLKPLGYTKSELEGHLDIMNKKGLIMGRV
ncbi:MAG: hypothetical protein ACFE9R_01050, partial [Candidatus Hermodarchaeota archaeon]